MKIRNGFVSNSSSSSFIIGVSKITDLSEAQTFLDSLKLDKYSVRIVKVEDLNRVYDAELRGDTIIVESFMYSNVRVSDMTPDDYVLVMNHQEGDDGDFWNDDWEEYNYDIDLDFFSEAAVALYIAINTGTRGLAEGEATYGAGRDG